MCAWRKGFTLSSALDRIKTRKEQIDRLKVKIEKAVKVKNSGSVQELRKEMSELERMNRVDDEILAEVQEEIQNRLKGAAKFLQSRQTRSLSPSTT
jgi:translation elongation factor EF-1alpha